MINRLRTVLAILALCYNTFAQIPVISSFTPLNGPIGSTVNITGSGFSTTAQSNLVTFQGMKANIIAATGTTLTVIVPAGASYGPIIVNVSDLTAISSQIFNVTNACTNSSFETATSIPSGNSPYGIATGDFNGDGKQDIVNTNGEAKTVSVFLGNGNGTLQSQTSYPVGLNAFTICVGDFNGDGKQDLVMGGASSVLSVLLGTGTGTFSAFTWYGVANSPTSLSVGDFNEDGKQDIISVNDTYTYVTILQGTGTGTFQPGKNVSVGANSYPSSVSIGDFNGDGKQDFATANRSSNTLSVLLGNGAGAFQAPINTALGGSPGLISVGDFDNDGKQDLGIILSQNNIGVLLGTGTGTFTTQTTYSIAGLNSFSIGDFNGDSKQDLVATSSTSLESQALVLLGTGTGTFLAPIGYPVGTNPRTVAIADFNGDGKQDLTTANRDSKNVSILISNCTDPLTITSFSPLSGPIGTKVTLTGTGFSNILENNLVTFQGIKAVVIGATGTTLTVIVPTGASYGPITVNVSNLTAISSQIFNVTNACTNSSFETATSIPSGNSPYGIATGDFNGDGKQDIVNTNGEAKTVSVFLGNGNGTLQSQTSYPVGLNPFTICVGDFNGDGKQDLVMGDANSSVISVLLGTGTGTFSAFTWYGVGYSPTSLSVGDFNEDGKQDIISVNDTYTYVTILQGTGTGTFQPGKNVSVGANSYPSSVSIGDFNGDGKQDFATANRSSNTLSVLLGNGAGAFQTPINTALDGSPGLISVGDFNNDGKQDLGIIISKNNIGVLLGTGTGTFTTQTTYSIAGLNSFSIGDFNGDSKQDLVATSSTSLESKALVLLGTGSGTFLTPIGYTVGINPRTIAVADFNGDGKQDLTIANRDSKNLSVLISNCTISETIASFSALSGPESAIILIYPNPASSSFSLNIPDLHQAVPVKITDITGKIVHSFEANNIETKISIQDLVNGIYYVNFQNNGIRTNKVLQVLK